MVTNTAGTANTEAPTTKENGECVKNDTVTDDYSNLKQTSNDNSKVAQVDQVVTTPQNDTSTAMSNSQNETVEGTSFSQPSSSNGIAGNPNYSSRSYGNGLPPPTSVTMNGPPQSLPNVSYPSYGSYNPNPGISSKPGPQPMQSGPPGPSYPPSMQPRYPSNQQPGATPTLNQLLTTPSRHPAQYSSYSNHPTSQPQPEFGQAHPQNWQARPQQYGRGPPDQQGKPDMGGYPPPQQQQQQQQQYSSSQQAGYHPSQGRYPAPAPTAGQAPYSQAPQYNSGMPPPGSAGYPSANPSPSRHPSYSGYPNYNHVQQPPFYATRPPQPQSYPPPSASQLASTEGRPYGQQEPQQSVPPSLGQDPMHQQSKDMMSPTRTPQPASNPGSVQSPMNATPPSLVHPGYPSVAQLRGQSPAPGSPASVGQPRGTPLSPPSVRPGTPHQQAPMRSASEHSDHSAVPGQSPVPGPNYGNYRLHSSQPSFGSQPPVYPQHMMSPQHQAAYPSNQQHPTPQHQGTPPMRQPGPPSVGKPPPQLQGPVSQSFSQSQPLPAYPQPSGHMQYYDNMPQQRPVMQGYTASSPAPPTPAERRPSRQGSQPSAAQLPDQSARQGAAAAAAAAMAAAAHSAQPGSVASQRPQTPNYYPQPVQQQPQLQQQPRPPHPNYTSVHQGNEMYQQSMGYPRAPHPGAPNSGPPHRMMGPPGMGGPQGMHRMHPPSQYPSLYNPSSGPPPQGHYPGYYPPNAGDPSHPPGVRPGHPTPGYDQPPQSQEETTKKPAARSASQKLAALFEPASDPGRRDFIERVLRYWEDKELPLKNAPLMGRKTLDLFRLFQTVKENGGMQEVTAGKKWTDISSGMGLGTATTSGFTLKKQYCKYLYGFECRERGEPEPQEALARVTEANRKRKQNQDNAKDDVKMGGISPQTPSPMHPHHGSAMPGQSYPPQQYPYTGQYPHPMGQQYRQPPPAGAPSYMMNPTSGPPHPHTGSYPQHPGHNSSMGPQPTPPQPMPNFPSGHEAGSAYPGPRMPLPPNASSGFPSQPIPTPVPSSAVNEQPIASSKVETPPKSEAKEKPAEQTQPEAPAASEADVKKSIKPPVPTSSSLAAANPFSEPVTSQYSSAPPGPPASYPSLSRTPQQQYPPRPLHDQYRPGFPQRPGMHPSQYPYSNSPVPHARLPSGPSHPGAMHSPHPGQSASPRAVSGYPPTTPLSSRPAIRSAQYPAQGGSFGSGPYPSMKRPSSEAYGPPSKYARPNGQPAYPPNHHLYRPESDPMIRQRYPTNGGPPPHSASPSLPGQVSTSQGRPHPSYHGFPPSSRRGPVPSLYSRHDTSLKSAVRWSHPPMQRTQSPAPLLQIQKFQQDIRAKRPLQVPVRAPYGAFKRDISVFPPDSVEATLPRLAKFQRKSCRDVGSVEAWRLVMALKSGLLAESSWALNALTILLYDQQSVGQLKLSQLPGLLDALVEHYRRCLSELFKSPKEQEALGVRRCEKHAEKEADGDIADGGHVSLISTKTEVRGKRKKGCSVLSKLSGKFSTMPLKVELRADPFLQDCSDRWDLDKSINLADDPSHIVLSFSQQPITDDVIASGDVSRDDSDLVTVVEATLEDVLSIPCSVLSPEDYGFVRNPTEDFDVKVEKIEAKEDRKIADDQNDVTRSSPVKRDSEVGTEETAIEKTAKTEEAGSCDGPNSAQVAHKDKENEKPPGHSVQVESNDNSLKNIEKNVKTEKDLESNSCNLNGNVEPSKKLEEKNGCKANSKTSDSGRRKQISLPPICNGLQVSFHTKNDGELFAEQKSSNSKPTPPDECTEKCDSSVKTEAKQEIDKNDANCAIDDTNCSANDKALDVQEKIAEVDGESTENGLSITTKVKKILEERNVVLLEDEAAGSDGSLVDALSGPLLSSKFASHRSELSNRLQCISNIIRSLSFIPLNMCELGKQRNLMRALSGILLLRHKHRTRKRRFPTSIDDIDNENEVKEVESCCEVSCLPSLSTATFDSEKTNRVSKSASKTNFSNCETKKSLLFAPESEKAVAKHDRYQFSATVLNEKEEDNVYSDPWWWDMVRRIREDALVILANISPTVDLSVLTDDHVPIAVLEACLHWCTCSSSDACDSFYIKARHILSAQRLALEILAKLSIKDQNVDLILATRPFSRVEKLFAYLVTLICDRRDPILREFAIVLLSNLSAGDPTAARAIALQSGSISGLITFLEECEETGLSNSKLFRQQSINCGTSAFMMSKAAKTLLSVAVIPENKPSFAKHQLRLLSLSMSQLLGSRVTSVISSLLYELSHEAST